LLTDGTCAASTSLLQAPSLRTAPATRSPAPPRSLAWPSSPRPQSTNTSRRQGKTSAAGAGSQDAQHNREDCSSQARRGKHALNSNTSPTTPLVTAASQPCARRAVRRQCRTRERATGLYILPPRRVSPARLIRPGGTDGTPRKFCEEFSKHVRYLLHCFTKISTKPSPKQTSRPSASLPDGTARQ
jgi:hypothetical protein